jgi:hypothetical protein
MKLRVLISILFVIATTITAVHELEHISGEHDSSSCQVCIVDHHSILADISNDISSEISFSFEEIVLKNQLQKLHLKKSANHSNAPPVIS